MDIKGGVAKKALSSTSEILGILHATSLLSGVRFHSDGMNNLCY